MHAKRIDHLKISEDPTRDHAWNLPSCGLMPRQTATPIIGTTKINATTRDTNSKPLGAVGRKLILVCIGYHVLVSYVAITGANYGKKFILML
jgi:hypothetical protein